MRVTVYMEPAEGERGAVLVMVALWLPVLLVVMTFVVDVGNWFVHKRHLQMQADAGALAAAGEFRFPCADAPILQKAAEYSGDTYNAQIGGTPAARVHRLINSKSFFDQPAKTDDTTVGTPCSAGMIDVKMTETDLPWYFRPLAGMLGRVPYINAQARISILQMETSAGALPVGVPDANPQSARAWFIDEDSGTILGTTALTKVGTSNGLGVWDNAAAPLPVTFDSSNSRVGVVVALGGSASTTCGAVLVECYDATAALTGGVPSRGILHIRGYSTSGTVSQPSGPPLLRSTVLVPGSCPDPYFSSESSSCTYGVRAKVDFGAGDPLATVGAVVAARVGGTSYPMSYDAATGWWQSATTIPLAAGAGPAPIDIQWEETKGTLTVGGKTEDCKTGNGNKCTGEYSSVQRAFSASSTRSGPVKVAQVWEDGLQWANSVERCSAAQASCTHNLVVRIGVSGNIANASSAGDQPVALRVIGGSQNQSLDCDKDVSQLRDELARGCAPTYTRNTGTACPASPTALWATAQPWHCVAVQTGSATNQVPAGMNERILGSDKPATCTAPNHWSQYPNLPAGDPRIMQVFLTPFGAFSGSGSTTVPVTGFATFYVTGWTASGGGFANPCQGNGDDPVPNNDAGYVVGHFIKYIQTLNTGGGTTACDVNALGACVAAMTR
jgi:Putative Flp pilus-assembly TadE/G-like